MDIKYIRVASDLHLEAFSGRDPETLALDFIPSDERDAQSVLVLAGDISSGPGQLVGFLKSLTPRFASVVYVPGNHEYYKQNYDAWNRKMTDDFSEYIPSVCAALGKVENFIIGDLRFVVGTLWGDGGPTLEDKGQVSFYLNDFRLIDRDVPPNDPRGGLTRVRFTVDDMIAINKEQQKAIETILDIPFRGRTVVVTHHMPSRRLVSPRFWPTNGSDGANGGFACNMDNVIATKEPWLWIHGHTHDTIDTQLWKTRIICNPAGYRGEWATRHNKFMASENGLKQAKVVPVFIEL